MILHKYHALGNDYLVWDASVQPSLPSPRQVARICHRNFGPGSDGILYGPIESEVADFGLRIFNPDGSEAEKSGNGLRIFVRYLYDQGRVRGESFTVETAGGIVRCQVFNRIAKIVVDMGRASFSSGKIPVKGESREVVREAIEVDGKELAFTAVTVGNPHCVVPVERANEKIARKYGPMLENHPLFPNRTNVQFLEIIDRKNIRIEIWERGAGYTLASGSSSCAAAAAAHRLSAVDNNVTVHMPGGILGIQIGEDYDLRMTGPVTSVGVFQIDEELFTFSLQGSE